jgi:hypothetical protein
MIHILIGQYSLAPHEMVPFFFAENNIVAITV